MQWPWTKREPERVEVIPSLELEELHARLRVMDDKLHELEREYRGIQIEWNSQFSKYQTLYARLAKQARRAEVALEDAPQQANGDKPRVEPHPGTAELAGRFRR